MRLHKYSTKKRRRSRKFKTRRRRRRGGNPAGRTAEQVRQLAREKWHQKRANMTPEQMAEYREKKRVYLANWRANLTPEQIAERNKKQSEYIKTLSPSNKPVHKTIRWLATLSPDRQAEYKEKHKIAKAKFFAKMTPDELAAYRIKQANARAIARANINPLQPTIVEPLPSPSALDNWDIDLPDDFNFDDYDDIPPAPARKRTATTSQTRKRQYVKPISPPPQAHTDIDDFELDPNLFDYL